MKKINIFRLLGGKTQSKKSRTASFAIVILAYIIIQAISLSGNLPRLYASLLVPVCCYTVAAIGLNLNVGISGELNLGQAGFMSIGAFTSAVVSGSLADAVPNAILRLIIAILCGMVLAGLFGLVISIPVLKLQGDYLAIVTLAFGQIIMNIINNFYIGVDGAGLHFSFVENTMQMGEGSKMLVSGPMGAVGIKTISTFTAGTILVLLALLVVYNVMDSRDGRAIMACRDNRIAAETVGINVSRTKTMAFVISSCMGGAAGALYALNYSSIAATKFDFNTSILILVYVVLGGLGNMTGTIIATALLLVLPEVLRFLSGYRMLIYAIVLIAIMLITNNDKVKVWIAGMKEKRNAKKGGEANV